MLSALAYKYNWTFSDLSDRADFVGYGSITQNLMPIWESIFIDDKIYQTVLDEVGWWTRNKNPDGEKGAAASLHHQILLMITSVTLVNVL